MKSLKKTTMSCVTHETPPDGNIILDLGFPPEEAARLLAETIREIEERRAAERQKKNSGRAVKSSRNKGSS